ncbi:N-acetylmuramoyl-L-alanine amidase [bacterium]|nr:N-acetylmuramoyl-L-alanine amidase [bacterium]
MKIFLIFFASYVFGSTLVVIYDGVSKGTVEPIIVNNFRYIGTDQIVRIGDGKRYYATKKFKESVRLWGSRVVFSPENPYVVIDGTPYNMGLPTKLDRKGLLVPLEGFFKSFAAATGHSIELTDSSIELSITEGTSESAYNKIDESPSESPKSQLLERKRKSEEETKYKGVIVIDAGHGGKDPGAIGPSGIREKDITLPIAKYLRDELKLLGFDAKLTRYSDVFIPLSKRTEIANKLNADMFISIHCNASKKSSSNGTQVFYLSPARTDEARATAALENQSLLLEDEPIIDNIDELQYIMADIAQSAHQRESSILAYIVEQNLADSIGTIARGPAGAGFYVLYGTYMPAILVETAFISNPDEEKMIALPKNQKKIAKAIAAGIAQFVENIKQ